MFSLRFWKSADVKNHLDRVFGLRAWGLLLYGILPANLALIGTLEVKLGKVDNLLPYIIPVSILPILITYLLILSRYRSWYLTRDFLKRRSAITTALILVSASLISGAAGILQGRYILSISNFWDRPHFMAIIESFLFGVSSLVITSTLFMSLLTKPSELPGIPSSKFVDQLTELRAALRLVQTSNVWSWATYGGDETKISTLRTKLTELSALFTKLDSYPGDKLAKDSLKPIAEYTRIFSAAISELPVDGGVKLKQSTWKVIFDAPGNLTENQSLERDRLKDVFQATQQIQALSLGE